MSNYHEMNNSESSSGSGLHSSLSKDPFYVVKEKVQDLIEKLSGDFNRWKELLETTNTSSNRQFENLTQTIKVALKKLTVDLNDLAQTTKIVSDNRLRFRDITDAELDSRKKFVNDMKTFVQDCQDSLDSDRTKRKIENDKREALLNKSDNLSGYDKEVEREAKEFVDMKQQTQVGIEIKQDQILDDMITALGRLGDVSDTINSELVSQNQMLVEFDNEMDETQGRMDIVMKKLNKMLGDSDRGRIGCIIFLIVTVIILLVIIIYA